MINKPPEILVIKSDLSELKDVENFILEIFRNNNLDQKNFNKIYLCVSEAVINSIKHGNKNDLKKKIFIEAEYHLSEILIRIEDEGEGFDYNKVDNPTIKTNLKKESGRGIFIIKSLSDNFEYNDKGNQIKLKIKCK